MLTVEDLLGLWKCGEQLVVVQELTDASFPQVMAFTARLLCECGQTDLQEFNDLLDALRQTSQKRSVA